MPVVIVVVNYIIISIEIREGEVVRLGKEVTSEAMSTWLVHVSKKSCIIRECFATAGASYIGHDVRSQGRVRWKKNY